MIKYKPVTLTNLYDHLPNCRVDSRHMSHIIPEFIEDSDSHSQQA